MAITTPDTPLVPTLSDVLLDIRDLPSYLLGTPCGVTRSSPLPSGALRSLRCDALGAARDSTALSPLSVPNRVPPPQQELPVKMPVSDSFKTRYHYTIVTELSTVC